MRGNVAPGYTEQVGPRSLTSRAGGEWYVALANQKNYVGLYLMPIYVFPDPKEKPDDSGRKLKCGKSCINFKRAEELPLEINAEIVGAYDADAYAGEARRARGAGRPGHAGG